MFDWVLRQPLTATSLILSPNYKKPCQNNANKISYLFLPDNFFNESVACKNIKAKIQLSSRIN